MKPGPLCILACQWCNLPEFWAWINATKHCSGSWTVTNAGQANTFLKETFGLDSRKELDADATIQRQFHEVIRQPFMAWQAARVTA